MNKIPKKPKEKKEKRVATPRDIVNYYYEFCKGKIQFLLFKNDFWICDENTNLWKNIGSLAMIKTYLEKPEFISFIKEKNLEYDYCTPNKWKDTFEYFKLDTRFHKWENFDFDSNPEILAFNNKKCIILNKLDKKEPWKVRVLEPDDYITMNTRFSLEFEFIDEEYYLFCKSLITNMFQGQDTAESFLMILGSSLYGELLYKKFFMNKGVGDNGRSFCSSLLKSVFGDFHGTFNSTFFTLNDNNDGEIKSPEAIQNKNKRLITLNEPRSKKGDSKKLSFDTEKLKVYSGFDIIKARLLNSNECQEIINKATLILNMNNLLKLVEVDSAFKQRATIIRQDTIFKENPIYENERQILKDTSFINDNKFKNHFMMVLLHYWEAFVENDLNLILSSEIINYTNECLNDFIDTLIAKNYTKTNNIDDFVSLDDIYDLYISEYNRLMNGTYALKQKSFKETLIQKRYIIKKIDKVRKGERIQKMAIVYLQKNKGTLNDNKNDEEL
jgi:hypothetical protein